MAIRAARRLGGVILAAMTLIPLGVSAQTASKVPVPVVIVVDVQAALQQSTAAKAVRAQRDQFVQTYQAEMEAARKSLKEAEAELLKQKAALPADAWQAKARTFEQQVYEFNQRFQKSNQAVEKSFRAAMGDLSQALAQVTEEVAGEMGANLVLHKMQVFLHDPRMEVTHTVIERLNRRFPSVTFPPPVEEGVTAPKPQPKKK
ncbi:MAG: OmpH family outer membrane protein [Alphaproteobacteria bacterium]|nr:OmpH family outer membrane protein [Alphaproteobacteria bacterium]